MLGVPYESDPGKIAPDKTDGQSPNVRSRLHLIRRLVFTLRSVEITFAAAGEPAVRLLVYGLEPITLELRHSS
jgi:hypothetical protein